MYQNGIVEVVLNLIKTLISMNAAVHNSLHGNICYVLLVCNVRKFTTFPNKTLFHGETFYIRLEMLHRLRRPQVQIPPLRNADGSWAKSDDDKAQTFADHLRQVFTPTSSLLLTLQFPPFLTSRVKCPYLLHPSPPKKWQRR